MLRDRSGSVYPMDWTIDIPARRITLLLYPVSHDQELRTGRSTGVTCWEGATGVSGEFAGKSVKGQGYVEMTGYAEAFGKRI